MFLQVASGFEDHPLRVVRLHQLDFLQIGFNLFRVHQHMSIGTVGSYLEPLEVMGSFFGIHLQCQPHDLLLGDGIVEQHQLMTRV